MRKYLKKLLPRSLKIRLIRIKGFVGQIVVKIFCKNRFLSSVYYAAFDNSFRREMQATLAGKAQYVRNLNNDRSNSFLLRRNVHRLEKGLIMRPRRPSFAGGYISETVDQYANAINQNSFEAEEVGWAKSVLDEYFKIVELNADIEPAKRKYENLISTVDLEVAKKPYTRKESVSIDITDEQFERLVKRRRSVRWYDDRAVPPDLVDRAILLASQAPSACNRQPYRFVAIEEPERARKISSFAMGTKGFSDNIPYLLVLVGDLSAYPYERDRHVIYIDGSLAAMQLMLALETLGLSSCPINWPDIESRERLMQQELKLEHYERPIMLISIGYALDDGGIAYSQKKGLSVIKSSKQGVESVD